MRKRTTPAINWKALPFIRMTLPLMLGIYLAELGIFSPAVPNFLLTLSFLSLLWLRKPLNTYDKRWILGVLIYFFLFLLGHQLTYYHNEVRHSLHFQKHISEKNWVVGTVVNMPQPNKASLKIKLKTQLIGTEQKNLQTCSGHLLIYLKNPNQIDLAYGDQLLIHCKILANPSNTNPNAFDYRQYLHFQNLHFQTFAQQSWKRIARNQGNTIWQSIFHLRKHCLETFQKHITSETERAIAAALILGYKEGLDDQLKTTYSESGAIHVLAVSGLHIGIVSGFIIWLFAFFPSEKQSWKWIKLAISLFAVWGFAFLSGFSSSVFRAAIMFSIFNSSMILQRNSNRYNSLAIAAFLSLALNPFALFEVGFQFSFLAVLGILFFLPKFKEIWRPKNRWIYSVWQLFLVGISAQLAVFPLVLYYFHQIPTYFWLSGILVVPLASVLMKLGLTLLFLNVFSEWAASCFGVLLTQIIALQNYLIGLIQELPFPVFSGFWISRGEVLLFYGGLLGFALLLLTQRFRYVVFSLLCLLMVSCVQLSNKFTQIHQKKIIIYHTSKNSMIDFVDGHTVYALGQEKLSANQFTFSVQNNRWASGIRRTLLVDKKRITDNNFIRINNHFQFYDKRLLIVDSRRSSQKATTKKLKVDYILLQNNPKVTMADLLNYYEFHTLIFDASNSYNRVNEWKKQCKASSITYKDIRKIGAYEINLNDSLTISVNDPPEVITNISTAHSREPSSEFPPSIADD